MLSLEQEPGVNRGTSELARVHYSLQRGGFITEVTPVEGGLVAHSTAIQIPMWNHGAWMGGSGDLFTEFAARVAEVQEKQQRRPVIYLQESESTREQLATAGFERFDEEAWMVFRGPLPEMELLQEMRVAPVENERELEQFIEVFQSAYQTRDRGYAEVLRRGFKNGIAHQHYLLLMGGRPVSIGTAAREGAHACIYNMGTPPAARGQGHAGRLLGEMLRRLESQGADTVFLQAEHLGAPRRLYERLGFKKVFVRAGYRRRDWRTRTIERTRLSIALGHSWEGTASETMERETKPLPADLCQRLTAFSEKYDVTPRELFSAAWACLLHRYTGEETIRFGEQREEGEAVARVVQIDRDQSVRDWLGSQRRGAEGHGEMETLLRFSAAGAAARFESTPAPLVVSFRGEPITSLEVHYRPGLFAKEAIRRMAAHLLTAVESILERPEGKVGGIELLPKAERHQLLVEWNQERAPGVERAIAQLFEEQAERTPASEALWFVEAGAPQPSARLTYAELNERANRLAHYLKAAGAGENVFVGVFMDRSPEMIVALLAILKAGNACVPMDPAYPAERVAFMMEDTTAPVILTQSALAARLGKGLKAAVVQVDAIQEELSAQPSDNPQPPRGLDHTAYVIYTSGSTGTPKGVLISNGAIAAHCVDCVKHYQLGPEDRVLQFSSFNFDASFEQILPALISGATLVVRDNEVWSTREFGQKLRDLRLTVTDIPTAYWHELAEQWHARPETIPAHLPRLVIVGGEALSPRKLALWQATPLNNARLINAYGPTETTITATSHEVPPRRNGEPATTVIPIGRPRGGRTAYVLDNYGSPTPVGVPGELHIGGPLLARGYHNRPDLTAARFIPNPFSEDPADRLYKTGDLARYLPDGNLEFLGRVDDQVKIRGFRIELGEIESALRQHPRVREALVLARPDESGEKRLAAYVTADAPLPSAREFRAFLQTKLPGYMVPPAIMPLDQWPLMPNGKIDRRALPPPREPSPGDGEVAGPKDPLELQIQLIFERVLKRAPIGVDVSFFELGGDSLQALELLVEIERATGKNLPLGTLYQSATVEALACEVNQRTSNGQWTSLVPLQAGGNRPPLFFLHTTPGDILAYGNLVYRLGPDQPCYGFQSLGLKEAALSHQTVEEMADYYTNLLTSFQAHGPYYLGGWCYGGILAVEMARRLRARGEKIALLALLETVAMPPSYRNAAYHAHRLRCLMRMSPRRWAVYLRGKAAYARQSKLANRMRFRQVEASGEEKRDPRLVQLEQVYNTNLAALHNFKSAYYDGKVTLFNAAERDPALIPDPLYGWVGLARDIEVHEVPGNHDTMLSEPHVAGLASAIGECLRRSQEISKPRPK